MKHPPHSFVFLTLFIHSGIGCCSVSRSTLLSNQPHPQNVHCNEVIGLVQDLWYTISHHFLDILLLPRATETYD